MPLIASALLLPCWTLVQLAPPEPAPSGASAATSTHKPTGSLLVDRYRSAEVESLLAKLEVREPRVGLREGTREAERLQAMRLERDTAIARAALRELRRVGLAQDATKEDRARAVETLRGLRGAIELGEALAILEGDANNPNLLARDRDARRALLLALAENESFGEPALVRLGVTADEKVRPDAVAALPTRISPDAERQLSAFLAGDRELYVNRAASIASAHSGAALIPSLIAAQSTPPRQKHGDEAWIALGKSVSYVAGVVPVVGDASGAFQPIPGTIFEGSVFRIMESVVVIYRTEVYYSLRTVVERETGQPAPPFGWDQRLWTRWYEQDFPALAAAAAARRSHEEILDRTRSANDSVGVER
ncbi:MAG: hypothetical protein ACKO3W_15190 [bacterium]